MRADRLLSILMLLQTHRRLTARYLAAELEVSERTIYRDIVALTTAGIPIYTESGPGGGISLIESYRTDLTGLRPEEAQALSMLTIPEPLVDLGVDKALKAALLKLAAAFPQSGRENQTLAQNRIHLDATWWFHDEEPSPHLDTIKQAVWQDRLLQITYQGDFNYIGEQVVAPYGLVAKTNVWYLVYAYAERIRIRRVSRIRSAALCPDTFQRPPDFDLSAFWSTWCAEYEHNRPFYEVQARVAPALAERLPKLLQNNQPDYRATPPVASAANWPLMTLRFESFDAARTRLLGFGGAIEVLAPLALRQSLADYAAQINRIYESDQS
ncbi:MAG: helix-turn-helix transcriptional regulator [Brevefilum sp.]